MNNTRYAFFDVDETLINLKSMLSFQSFYHRRCWGELQGAVLDRQLCSRFEAMMADGADRSRLNAAFFQEFQGRAPAEVSALACEWFEQVRHAKDFFIAPVLALLQGHQRDGVEPVFVSGSSVEILQPLAKLLNVSHVLANRLEVAQGLYTGRLMPPQTIAAGKQEAIQTFLEQHQAHAADCFGYGDHLSDLPLLETVGHPTVVARDPKLIAVAQARGWPLIPLPV